MSTAAVLGPREETFEEVKALVYKTVWDFKKRYGGDFEELLADGLLFYAHAYDTYDPATGVNKHYPHRKCPRKFSAYVRDWVYIELLNLHRARLAKRRNAGPMGGSEAVEAAPDYPRWHFSEFVEGLSEDAAMVATLVLEAPAEIAEVAESKGGTPRNWRSTIRTYLSSIGWATDRINETFQEIGEALAG